MRVVVLTGAGISAESGIRTFRGSDGLWEGHRIEDVATPEGFMHDPALVYKFYNHRRRHLADASVQPNAAHLALSALEAEMGDDFLLVTQNIDDLHQRAGSKRVLPMHGELRRARCQLCSAVNVWLDDFTQEDSCPECNRAGGLRPHVVWFGEMPLFMEEIQTALLQADVFAAIGTSGNVYPAAGFGALAARAGAVTYEINLEPSKVVSDFDHVITGPATQTVPEWVASILKDYRST